MIRRYAAEISSTVTASQGGESDRQVGVTAQRPEGLLGAVGGGREPVRAEPDPGEEGDQREPVKEPPVTKVPRLPNQQLPKSPA